MNDFTTYKRKSDHEKDMATVEGKRVMHSLTKSLVLALKILWQAAVRKLLPMIDAFGSAFDMINPQSEGEKVIDESYR